MVRGNDKDTGLLTIDAGVLHGDTLTAFVFIICQDYFLQTSIDVMKENGFTLKRQEVDYISQKLLLTQITKMILRFRKYTCYIVKSKLQEALDKIEFMYLNQDDAISSLKCKPLK